MTEHQIDPLNDRQYRALVRAYELALKEDKEIFVFEGSELLVKYAKYLIEHIENIRSRKDLKIVRR